MHRGVERTEVFIASVFQHLPRCSPHRFIVSNMHFCHIGSDDVAVEIGRGLMWKGTPQDWKDAASHLGFALVKHHKVGQISWQNGLLKQDDEVGSVRFVPGSFIMSSLAILVH